MVDRLRVILELDPGVSPIQGRVQAEGGRSCRFDGYVQLIGHLEALQNPGPRAAADEPDREKSR
jgi:hypothetical protein